MLVYSWPNNIILTQTKIKTPEKNLLRFKKRTRFYQTNRNDNNMINLDMDSAEEVLMDREDFLVVMHMDSRVDLIPTIYLASSSVEDLVVEEGLVVLLELAEQILSVK